MSSGKTNILRWVGVLGLAVMLAAGAVVTLRVPRKVGGPQVGEADRLQVTAASDISGEYVGHVALRWVVNGVYSDTLPTPTTQPTTTPAPAGMPTATKVPPPPELGGMDLALSLGQSGLRLTLAGSGGLTRDCSYSGTPLGYILLDRTLVFSPEHTIMVTPIGPTPIAGTPTATPSRLEIGPCVRIMSANNVTYIESEEMAQVAAGRPVRRAFRLTINEVKDDGNTISGEYRETVKGFLPTDVTAIGYFVLKRPVQTVVEPGSTATPTVTPSPTANGSPQQRITLHRGWNWVSFNRRLTAADVASALAPINGLYSIVMGEEGTYLPPPNDARLNTLTRFQEGKGYQMRLTQDAVLTVNGDPIPPSTPIQLAPGWRWVAYLRDTPMEVTTALGSIAGKYSVVLGETGTYLPPPADGRWNTLQTLAPGQGYLIRMTEAGTLTYPATTAATRVEDGSKGAKQPELGCDSVAGPAFTEFFGEVVVDGRPAAPGTLVEAYSARGERVGCFRIASEGTLGYMRVYGADPVDKANVVGMRPGELVAFRINGAAARGADNAMWQDDKEVHRIRLEVGAAK